MISVPKNPLIVNACHNCFLIVILCVQNGQFILNYNQKNHFIIG